MARETFVLIDQYTPITDVAGHLTKTEKHELFSSFKAFRMKHNIRPYLVIYNDVEINDLSDRTIIQKHGIASPSGIVVIIIDLKDNKSNIIFNSGEHLIDKSELNNISFQFIDQNLKDNNSEPLIHAIPNALNELVNTRVRNKVARNKDHIEYIYNPWEDPLYYMYYMIWFSFLIFSTLLFLVLKDAIRYNKIKYYKFSQPGNFAVLVLSIAIFAIHIYYLSRLSFFFDHSVAFGVFAVTFFGALTGTPIKNLLEYAGGGLYRFSRVLIWTNNKQLSSGLPLVPAMLLLNRWTSNISLMELTFRLLLIKKQIEIVYIADKKTDSSVTSSIVRGPKFNPEISYPYETPFLEPLKYLPENTAFNIREYVAMIESNIGIKERFGIDLVSPYLVSSGLLTKSGWIKKELILSKKGKSTLSDLTAKLENDREALLKRINHINKSWKWVFKIRGIHFLIKDFEKILTQMRRDLLKHADHHLNDAPLYAIIRPEFRLNEFSATYDRYDIRNRK